MTTGIIMHRASDHPSEGFEHVVAFASLPTSGTPSYHREVWGALQRMGIEPSMPCPETGEDWQYMGTELHRASDGTERWMHAFRHRSRPPHGTREYVYAPASEDMTLLLDMEWDNGRRNQ